MSEKNGRGRKELDVQTWPFGSAVRFALFATLLTKKPPKEGWTKRELEEAASSSRGGIDPVLRGALDWGLVEQSGGRWHQPSRLPPLAAPLQEMIKIVRRTESTELSPLPTTPPGRRPKAKY